MKRKIFSSLVGAAIAACIYNQTFLGMVPQSSGFIDLTIVRCLDCEASFSKNEHTSDSESKTSATVSDSKASSANRALSIDPDAQEFLSKKTFSELLDNPNGTLLAVVSYRDKERTISTLDGTSMILPFDQEQTVYQVYEGTLLTKHLRKCNDTGTLILENIVDTNKADAYRLDPISTKKILHVFYYLTPSAKYPFVYIGDDTELDPIYRDRRLPVGALKAVNGDPEEQTRMGLHGCWKWENDHKKSKQTLDSSMLWIQKAANKGNSDAIFSIGKFYEHEEKNIHKALDCYTKAADAGEANAMICIGDLYAKEEGIIEQDISHAIMWYTKAAERGHLDAMFTLGSIYNDNHDAKKALEWYIKASHRNNHSCTPTSLDLRLLALYTIGNLYEKGDDGVEKNIQKACEYYQMAADEKFPAATVKLGLLCVTELGVGQDIEKALELYARACEQYQDPKVFPDWIDLDARETDNLITLADALGIEIIPSWILENKDSSQNTI